jgi:heme/copper-type cytochrome/quinol oxidase subunit 2
VDVVAYQWNWQMRYPSANVTTQALLVVPNGTDVYLRLESSDVLHSLSVPGGRTCRNRPDSPVWRQRRRRLASPA